MVRHHRHAHHHHPIGHAMLWVLLVGFLLLAVVDTWPANGILLAFGVVWAAAAIYQAWQHHRAS